MNIKSKLEDLDKDNLIQIIIAIHNENSDCKKVVNTLMAMHDPKAMYQLLNKQITSVKNGKKFIDYYEADKFCQNLDSIAEKIEKYLCVQDSQLALKLIKRLIEIDAGIFERIDDSNGCLGDFYYDLYRIMDKAFTHSKESPEDIAQYLVNIYMSDEYGNRGHIFDQLNNCLNPEVAAAIEKLIPPIQEIDLNSRQSRDIASHKNYMQSFGALSIHKKLADIRKDVDRYIELVQKFGLRPTDVLDIAKRLNAAFRSYEAIQWLTKPEYEYQHHTYQRDDLLIEAYMLESQEQKAKQVIWEAFAKTLSSERYLQYIKIANTEEKEIAGQKALEYARNCKHIHQGIKLLHDLGNYDEIETLFHERETEIDGTDYSVYRKLSTDMHKHGKNLVASLMRRKLVESILGLAKSKAYRYAASDLKLAGDYAHLVDNWYGYLTHSQFIESLKSKHGRKQSFWNLMM